MDRTIESYMSFCDDFDIVEEGLRDFGARIIKGFKKLIEKIIAFFKKLLINVNYFKSAKLPKQMNDDLELTIQNLQPRHGLIYKFMNEALAKINADIETQQDEEIKRGMLAAKANYFHEGLELSIDDATSAYNDTINSAEYARIMNKDYDFSTLEKFPLGQVIQKLKQCQADSTKCKVSLDEFDQKIKNGIDVQVSEIFHNLYSILLKIYQEQIKLLNVYFAYAKASLTSVVNNVRDRAVGDNKFTVDYGTEKIFSGTKNQQMCR